MNKVKVNQDTWICDSILLAQTDTNCITDLDAEGSIPLGKSFVCSPNHLISPVTANFVAHGSSW